MNGSNWKKSKDQYTKSRDFKLYEVFAKCMTFQGVQ